MDTKIKLQQRSYGGKKFRPQPFALAEDSTQLVLCITPWGTSNIVEEISESVQSFLSLAFEDTDVTMAYDQKQNLHKKGNILRMAIIGASEKIFKNYNTDEYRAGFEIFAGIKDGPQWIYISCGQPNVVLMRPSMGIIPLSQSIDMNVLAGSSQLHDPLPNQLLGLGQNPPIQFGNFRIQKGDQIALVSRTFLPNQFFELNPNNFNEKEISNRLAIDNQEIPFWLGMIQFEK